MYINTIFVFFCWTVSCAGICALLVSVALPACCCAQPLISAGYRCARCCYHRALLLAVSCYRAVANIELRCSLPLPATKCMFDVSFTCACVRIAYTPCTSIRICPGNSYSMLVVPFFSSFFFVLSVSHRQCTLLLVLLDYQK